jgi:hypothetical protein
MFVNLLALLLFLLAAYLGWWAVSFGAPLWWLGSVVALVAAIGLFRRKRWAQFMWHAIAFFVSLSWLVSIIRVAVAGWPYPSFAASVISLLPGVLLLFVCGCGSFVVARRYRGAHNAL